MLTGLYVPGDSWLHRAAPGWKILGLLVLTTALMAFPNLWVYLGATVAVVLLFQVTGLGWRNLWAQVWPLRWFLVVFVPFQYWQNGADGLVRYAWSVLLAIGLASAVTLSTRTNDMLDAVVRGLRVLRPLGMDPERVGLAMALAIRQIPVLVQVYGEVREAQLARGGISARAIAAPMLTRTLTQAQRVGEALAARGVDD